MYRIAFSMALAFSPAVLTAQAAQVSARGEATAEVKRPAQVSANASVDAEISAARERGVPAQPVERRAAEARAKGRTEAQAALAARELRVNLEAAHDAMVRAGRMQPSDGEVERGGYAIERGYTSAQVEAIAKAAPAERSLVVSFDVLTRLVARGVASEKALAQVQSKLEERATDAQIEGLVVAAVHANGHASPGAGAVGAAARGNAAAGATVGGAAAGATGAVGAAAGAVTRRP